MSRTERDTTRIVRSWLEEGADRIPDRVLDAVEARIPATHQRRSGWLARRFSIMNTNTFRFGVAAAAVVVLALIGWRFLPASNTGGLPTPTPTPTPLPTLNGQQDLDPGTYQGILPLVPDLGFTVTVPDGWSAGGQSYLVASDADPPAESRALLFWKVENLYANPLAPGEGGLDPPVGPSVEDLVMALATQENITTSESTDVRVGGYPAQLLEVIIPSDADFQGCGETGSTSRPFAIWFEPGGDSWRCMQGPGQTDYVYVVDVDGERVVITLVGYPEWNASDLDEMQAMVDSIEFFRR